AQLTYGPVDRVAHQAHQVGRRGALGQAVRALDLERAAHLWGDAPDDGLREQPGDHAGYVLQVEDHGGQARHRLPEEGVGEARHELVYLFDRLDERVCYRLELLGHAVDGAAEPGVGKLLCHLITSPWDLGEATVTR